ncbi:MAG TPA: glycosyltransferase [Phenylobacterium sp.]|nr:glycosyltransferase [Phenylobacterium sp.]
MTAEPEVSVIIPHYHDLRGLDLCLQALERQTYPRERFEIVVADNNSPEGEAAVAKAIAGRARLVVVTEKGAGPARNGAVAVARGALFAFTDSDCVPEPQWLAEGLAGLKTYDFVGGHVRVLLENPPRMTAVEAFERVFAFDFKSYIQKKGFTGSGNMFCPRAVFEAVGGFRNGMSEDVDWSHRARDKGFRLGFAPRAVVGHPARRSWDDLETKWRRVNAEIFQLSADAPMRRFVWLLRALALPVSAVVHTPKVLFSAELNTPGQRLAALRVLYRLRMWRLADSMRLFLGGKA